MATARTKLHRAPHKQVSDSEVVRGILERAMIAHVGICVDGQPFVLPVACAPYGDELLMHGSPASRLFMALAKGSPACVTITFVEGLVLARSAFESSMHYRSLMALGNARELDEQEKPQALQALTDHLFPERRGELRASTQKELKATVVVAFPLNEISVKVSSGQPDDSETDLAANVWAGIIPITSSYAAPVPATNLREGIEVPKYISRWQSNRT